MRIRSLIAGTLILSLSCLLVTSAQSAAPEKQPEAKAEAKTDAKAEAAAAAREKAKAEMQAKKKAEKAKAKAPPAPWVTPTLPGGKVVVTDKSDDFIKNDELPEGVTVAKTAPTIDFAYYPGQTYRPKIWSNWGDSTFANGKYYGSFCDHGAPGTAFVFEYDPEKKTFREVMDTNKLLKMPEGHYTPGKIHSRIDMGKDGWLYFATHRGSTTGTTEATHYQGDWILRSNPTTGEREAVVQGPAGKHCIPNSVLDPERLIFYGGTAVGDKSTLKDPDDAIMFFAYDVKNKKLLYKGNNGPQRYMLLAQSTGKLYYTPKLDLSPLMCYDPSSGKPPYEIPGVEIGIRAATRETANNMVFTASQKAPANMMYSFNTKTEKAKLLGPVAIGPASYVAACVADPSGRYVYYTVGAHGGGERTGTPVVQFDTKTAQRKVIAFLTPFYQKKYGFMPVGSYSIAIDDKGETVFVTWNIKRDICPKAWDTVGLTAIHIPESERQL